MSRIVLGSTLTIKAGYTRQKPVTLQQNNVVATAKFNEEILPKNNEVGSRDSQQDVINQATRQYS